MCSVFVMPAYLPIMVRARLMMHDLFKYRAKLPRLRVVFRKGNAFKRFPELCTAICAAVVGTASWTAKSLASA